jgi:hypothetical protein
MERDVPISKRLHRLWREMVDELCSKLYMQAAQPNIANLVGMGQT